MIIFQRSSIISNIHFFKNIPGSKIGKSDPLDLQRQCNPPLMCFILFTINVGQCLECYCRRLHCQIADRPTSVGHKLMWAKYNGNGNFNGKKSLCSYSNVKYVSVAFHSNIRTLYNNVFTSTQCNAKDQIVSNKNSQTSLNIK